MLYRLLNRFFLLFLSGKGASILSEYVYETWQLCRKGKLHSKEIIYSNYPAPEPWLIFGGSYKSVVQYLGSKVKMGVYLNATENLRVLVLDH